MPPQLVILNPRVQKTSAETSKSIKTLDDDSPYQSARLLQLMSAIAAQTGGYVAGSRFPLSTAFEEKLWTEMYRSLVLEGKTVEYAFNQSRVTSLAPSAYCMPDLVGPVLFAGSIHPASLRAPKGRVSTDELIRMHRGVLQDEPMAPVGMVRRSGLRIARELFAT